MNALPTFQPLSRLFKGDTDRMCRALEIFERVTREDVRRMDQVYASCDWDALGRLVHRTRSGCLQIGENTAADGLAALEQSLTSAGGSDAFSRKFSATRAELDGVLRRVTEYLATKGRLGEA